MSSSRVLTIRCHLPDHPLLMVFMSFVRFQDRGGTNEVFHPSQNSSSLLRGEEVSIVAKCPDGKPVLKRAVPDRRVPLVRPSDQKRVEEFVQILCAVLDFSKSFYESVTCQFLPLIEGHHDS